MRLELLAFPGERHEGRLEVRATRAEFVDLAAVSGCERTDFRCLKTRHDQSAPLGHHTSTGLDEKARQSCGLWRDHADLARSVAPRELRNARVGNHAAAANNQAVGPRSTPFRS